MLGIITCLRARVVTRNWDYHVWLLQRTLDSMLAQTNKDFLITVVCHEIPDVPHVSYPAVRFVSVSFPPPACNNDDMCADKALKLSAGARLAISAGCNYIMFNDADDLVSRRISSFVAHHQGGAGWYSASEFFYTYGGYWLRNYLVPADQSGPCAIFRADLLKFLSPPYTGAWFETLIATGNARYCEMLARRRVTVNPVAAAGHTEYRRLLAQEGHVLRPLPFTANVVINHFDSTSHVAGGHGSRIEESPSRNSKWYVMLSQMKQRVLGLRSLRPLTLSTVRSSAFPADGKFLSCIDLTGRFSNLDESIGRARHDSGRNTAEI